jgi:hypothetical protein
MSEIKLPVRVGLVKDGDESFFVFFDGANNEIGADENSMSQIAAALNAAPKRAFAELTEKTYAALVNKATREVRADHDYLAGDADLSVEIAAAVVSLLKAFAAPVAETLEIGYTNYRGEWSMRRIRPVRLWVGSTDWHPEPGLLLEALDLGKNETRHFAVKDFGPKREAAPIPAKVAEESELEKKARKMYDNYVDNSNIHCNRFSSWAELSAEQKAKWVKAAAPGTQGGREDA